MIFAKKRKRKMLRRLRLSVFPVLLFLTIFPTLTNGENILLFLGITTYSHRLSIWPLISKLADRGHNITVFSSHPPRSLADLRIHEIVPSSLVEFNSNFFTADLLSLRLSSIEDSQGIWDSFPPVTLAMYAKLAKDPELQRWMETAKFDLVILDSLYCDFALGLAYKFSALTVGLTTSSPYMWEMDRLGGVTESWIPDIQFGFPEDMSFVHRVVNVVRPIYWDLLRRWWYFPGLEKILREDLKMTGMPRLQELERNLSLVLVNTHYGEEYARSIPPNMIPIGGLHCFHYKEEGDLKELGQFMTKSGDEGFIYVSFGSAAAVSKMPGNLQKIFFDTMRTAPVNFVLKWEGDIPSDLPKNVFTANWLPQQNILGHPNIRGFVTHGGLLGIQEAVCSGVPLIVLPMIADQDFNANRIENRKIGIKLEWQTLTEHKLTNAVSTILTDPSYKENMKKTSSLFLDRPQNPLETGVYWIEYILRNGHTPALQPLAIHQTWYERRLLDVWLILFLATMASLSISIKLVTWALARKSRPKMEAGKEEKKLEQNNNNNNDINYNNGMSVTKRHVAQNLHKFLIDNAKM